MLIRQSKNSFIRCTERYGYITNQLTRYDRSYDKYGAEFLKQITRNPQKIDDIIDRLCNIYGKDKRNIIKYCCPIKIGID